MQTNDIETLSAYLMRRSMSHWLSHLICKIETFLLLFFL